MARKLQLAKRFVKKKSSSKAAAAVSVGQMKKHGVGELEGTGEIVSAFGLRPANKRKSGFEDSPPDGTPCQVLVGSGDDEGSSVNDDVDDAAGSGDDEEGSSMNSIENSQQRRQEGGVARARTHDYFDSFTSSRDDLDDTDTSMPGLEERMDQSRELKATTRTTPTNVRMADMRATQMMKNVKSTTLFLTRWAKPYHARRSGWGRFRLSRARPPCLQRPS